ncbi:MAG TPA: M57 family metalloprotease [Anaeromyxobacteraceae bacterium]|nr:M57 family metalloprotease [Anaeromyxobacteraceae bacterium]
MASVSLACGGGSEVSEPSLLTWEEFRDAAYQEPDTGVWITNGDELAETEALLREAYDRYAAERAEPLDAKFARASDAPLIVNTVSGRDDVWPQSVALNITYCVDQKSFGSRYAAVVSAMNAAAADWESAASVNFVHASQYDANCTSRTNVVFNVRQVTSVQYLARAFFPSTSRRSRELLIASSAFGNIQPWTLTGVLRHELGHSIGFRHEHTRPEAGTCYENDSWRALTAYDSDSVMHYPQCNGTNDGDLVLTSLDRSGAAALY